MKVYHGSSVAVNVPEIRRGRFSKDFGEGFYCTTLLEQAKRWASRKKPSVVSVYEYLPSEGLKVLEFTEMTDEWLDFIVNCRRGASHDYDIVIGAMANDQVFNYINDYVDGILTKEQFWVLAKFKKPTNQICFCSENALKCLKYIESLNID
jgi:hypothetical protein